LKFVNKQMNPIELSLRIAAPSDAEALAELNRLFNQADEPAELWAERLADPRQIEQAILAEVNGQIVGMAGLRLAPGLFYPEPQAEVTELYVLPDFRHKGVGRALLEKAEALARQAGANELLIRVDAENEPARLLYHSLGYEEGDLSLIKEISKGIGG
jgi:GNAT superfamily N-acetyltransferase